MKHLWRQDSFPVFTPSLGYLAVVYRLGLPETISFAGVAYNDHPLMTPNLDDILCPATCLETNSTISIRARISGNAKAGVAVDVGYLGGLNFPIFRGILDDTKSVDPKEVRS